MKKFFIKSYLTLLVLHTSTIFAFDTIKLHNATSCQIIINKNGTQTIKSVPAVDLYSFYFTSQEFSSRTYYSTISASSEGIAAVSDFSPGIEPPLPEINIGFAPSAGYTQGSIYASSTGGSKFFDNWYVYQAIDQQLFPHYCSIGSCLNIKKTNPCLTTTLIDPIKPEYHKFGQRLRLPN